MDQAGAKDPPSGRLTANSMIPRSPALRHHRPQQTQVFAPAHADGIRKAHPVAIQQGHVLDLDPGIRPRPRPLGSVSQKPIPFNGWPPLEGEEDIQMPCGPAGGGEGHLPPGLPIPPEGWDTPRGNALRHHRVGATVCTPTQPAPISTRSSVQASLRRELSLRLSWTGAPGDQQPDMLPVLGTWAVTTAPSPSATLARNRL